MRESLSKTQLLTVSINIVAFLSKKANKKLPSERICAYAWEAIDICIITQKKPQQNAEARPLPPWYPYCGVKGGDILL